MTVLVGGVHGEAHLVLPQPSGSASQGAKGGRDPPPPDLPLSQLIIQVACPERKAGAACDTTARHFPFALP